MLVEYFRNFKNLNLIKTFSKNIGCYSPDYIKDEILNSITRFNEEYSNFNEKMKCTKSKRVKSFYFNIKADLDIASYLDNFQKEIASLFDFNGILKKDSQFPIEDIMNPLKEFNYDIKNKDVFVRKVSKSEAKTLVSDFTKSTVTNLYRIEFMDFRYNFYLTYDELIKFIENYYYVIDIEFVFDYLN